MATSVKTTIAGCTVLLTALGGGLVLQQQNQPTYVLTGEVDFQLPNDGGLVRGALKGFATVVKPALVQDAGVQDAGIPDAGSAPISTDAGVVQTPTPTPAPVSSTGVLSSVTVTGSGQAQFGMPLANGAVKDASSLVLRDPAGNAVPASFSKLAHWPNGSWRWALVTADVAPGQYRLEAGTPVAVTAGLHAAIMNGIATVNVGRQTYTVSGTEILGSSVGSAAFSGDINGAPITLGAVRGIKIVSQTPQKVTVEVENVTSNAGASLRRVYDFYANRVDIRFILTWEQGTNVVINRAEIVFAAPTKASYVSAGGLNATGSTAAIEQRLRANRTAPYVAVVSADAVSRNGSHATDAVLESELVAGGYLRFTPHNMAYLEPQSIVANAAGVKYSFVAGRAALSNRQALYSELSVELSSTTRKSPLVRPIVMPTRAALLASGAVEKGYVSDPTVLSTIIDRSIQFQAQTGLTGVNAWGSFPRYPNEVGTDVYANTVWAEYHNSAEAVTFHALSQNRADWIEKLSRPGYLRQLYTQGWHCAPSDSTLHCGAFPSGYQNFRNDFNSSHAYTRNLHLMYFITGDQEIPRFLLRGALGMRKYLCSARPTAACGPTVPPSDQWAALSDRVFSQHQEIFHFLGMTVDPTFTEDFYANEERALKQAWRYGTAPDGSPAAILGSATRSTQIFMEFIYDLRGLLAYAKDLRDAGRTADATRVESVIKNTVATLIKYAGPGPADRWPNRVSYSGAFSSITKDYNDADSVTYSTGKGGMTRGICAVASAADCQAWVQWVEGQMKAQTTLVLGKEFGLFTSGLAGIY